MLSEPWKNRLSTLCYDITLCLIGTSGAECLYQSLTIEMVLTYLVSVPNQPCAKLDRCSQEICTLSLGQYGILTQFLHPA